MQGVARDAPRLDVALLVRALDRLAAVVPAPTPPAEVLPRAITLAERARFIRAALAGAGSVVLQDLLTGVRDRVVAAVTFLALLELVKRREVTVEQDRPWGPILVRSTPRPTPPVPCPRTRSCPRTRRARGPWRSALTRRNPRTASPATRSPTRSWRRSSSSRNVPLPDVSSVRSPARRRRRSTHGSVTSRWRLHRGVSGSSST